MKVVIIGGGIAGLTTGILLQRKGHKVSISEREPDIPNRGNAFLMHAEADAILKRLTFDFQKSRMPGRLIDSFCLRRPDNRIVRYQKLDPWHCVTRKDIIGLLYKLVPEGLVIHNNRRFTGFRFENGNAVEAVFANGETESGDLFVGADGGNSEVRQYIFGPTTYTPVEVREILGGVHAPGLSAALRTTFTKYQHEHLGLSCGIIPTSVNGVVWYMQYDCRINDPKGNSKEDLKDFCLTMVKDFPQLVTDTIRMDDFSNTYVWNTQDFDLLPKFHSGNVVLVGDSAHLSLPFTSAGTTNAFVDAATLADLLPNVGFETAGLEDLFTAFYDMRAGRIASQIKLGRDLKKTFLSPAESSEPSIPLIGRPENRRITATDNPPIRIFYFTDPICSTCWASQPQLRKLYLEYGDHVEVEYKMGGLLPSWDNFSRNGIRTPSDVAVHWEEVCAFYNMPIDKQIWLEDPLPSSYPPSIAFKAAQLQDTAKAIVFLRRIREMVFMEKKNIIQEEFLTTAAYEVGLDTIRLMRDLNGVAKDLFREDLKLTEQLKVSTLPTLYFADDSAAESSRTLRLEGFQPYTAYEELVRQILPNATKVNYDRSPEALFNEFHTMTLREFAFLRYEPESESHLVLKDLASRNLIRKFESEAGNIWLGNFNSMEVFK